MKKIKIGLPRAFLYYRYGILWKTFFTTLGCKIVLSPETNKEIISLGSNNAIDECCLSYKIYLGHAIYLKEKCDYILVPRICNYGKKDKVCTRFNGTYDNLKFLLYPTNILTYNIHHTKFKYEFIGFLKMGLKISKNPVKVIYSYLKGKKKQKQYYKTKENEQIHKLHNKNIKVLLISHFYNINDNYIGSYIKEYLEKKDITILYSDDLDKSLAISFADYFSETLYWKYSKEMIGSLYYYRHQIQGLIFLSTYPCSLDALVNNLAIYKNNYLSILNLIIDENTSKLNLETKLESFIDIIKGAYHE